MKLKYAAAFIFLTPFLAQAETPAPAPQPGTHDPAVNRHQHHQKQRIQQGVASGELTHNEAKGLRSDRREINQKEQAYKADGTLTKGERKDLHQDLNQSSKDIYHQKHDEQQRSRAE